MNYLNSKEISFGETSLGTILEEEIEIIWTKPLHLFSINDTSSNIKNCFTGRIYRVTITEDDKVEMDLIPCLDDKGIPCMYDLIYQKTFYNKNSDGADFKYCIEGKVPPYYKRLQYLESTGTQWIDTGIITDGTYNIGIKYQPRIKEDGTVSTSYLCGRSDHWNCPSPIPDEYGDSMVYFDGTDNLIYTYSRKRYRMQKSLNPDYIPADVTDVIWKEGDNKITINGITSALQNWSADTINTNNALNKTYWIFETNTTRLPRHGSKIFNFRIQKDDIYVFYGLPIIDENGVACMFDLVTAKPFYNAGTGSFIYFPTGKFETNYTNFCQLGVIGNRLGTGEEGLPPTYKRVNYLQSTGTQYIDTRIATDGTYTIRAKLKATVMQQWSAWGRAYKTADYDVGGSSFCRLTVQSGYYGMNFLYYWNGSVHGNRPNITDVEWDINESNVWEALEGVKYAKVNGYDASIRGNNTLKVDASNPNNLTHYVFWANGIFTNGNTKAKMKLYYFQMINGSGKIVLDLIPCLDTKGTPCMFDRIANKTFYNQGTGDFLYG